MVHRPLKRIALYSAASAAALGGALATPALAQDNEARSVEQIIVTAQKREQGVQDVPISIGAYDENALENAGVDDIKDLMSIAPGLMVTSTQAETITTARIRGIGTVGDNFGLESSVGVYIDGVFRARNGVGFGDLGELERIEVLRGPQGTLFGKNTSAGVLNVVTKGPEFEFGAGAEVTAGNFGLLKASGFVTGPIVEDVLAFRLFGVRGERDGFNDLVIEDGGVVSTGESDNQDYYSLRGQLLFTPTDTLEARFIVDYTDRDEICCSAVQWDYNAGSIAGVNATTQDADDFVPGTTTPFAGDRALQPADPDERLAFTNEAPLQKIEDWGFSAEVTWDVGPGTLTSVSGFRNWENSRSQDIDYSAADYAFRDIDKNFSSIERFSQELRYAGVAGRWDYLVGGFYSNEDLELGDAIQLGDDWSDLIGLNLAQASGGAIRTPETAVSTLTGGAIVTIEMLPDGVGAQEDLYNQEATSVAVFTHNTFNVTDALSLTGGLRYTYEEKDLTASFETNTLGCAILESVFGVDPAGTLAGLGDAGAAGLAGAVCNLPYNRSALDALGYDQSREDEELSGVLKAAFRVNDDLLVYGGYSRGFKAGGFNLDRQLNGTAVDTDGDGLTDSFANVDTSFEPEIIDALELGFKSELLNNALLLNANAFYQEVTDFQLNTFNGLVFVVESVDQVVSQGFEVDALYLPPVDGLTIQGGFAYVDAVYEEINSTDPLVQALEGENLSLSPEFFLNGGVSYERPLSSSLNGLVSIDGRWVSEYNTGSDLDPEKEQDAFGLLNARIGVSRDDGLWSIELFGQNLTDETYAQVVIDGFGQGSRAGAGTSLDARGTAGYSAFLGAPRTWGVTLKTEF